MNPPPWKKILPPSEIYDCGWGSLMESINTTQLLEIDCCNLTLCVRSVSDSYVSCQYSHQHSVVWRPDTRVYCLLLYCSVCVLLNVLLLSLFCLVVRVEYVRDWQCARTSRLVYQPVSWVRSRVVTLTQRVYGWTDTCSTIRAALNNWSCLLVNTLTCFMFL